MTDELVEYLKKVREAHGISQETLAKRMGILGDTLRHIEKGRRPLPDYRNGFVEFVRLYLAGCGATPSEQSRAVELARKPIEDKLARWRQELEELGTENANDPLPFRSPTDHEHGTAFRREG